MTNLVHDVLVFFRIGLIVNENGEAHCQMSVETTLDSDKASCYINEAIP